jgi:hypothetical protein
MKVCHLLTRLVLGVAVVSFISTQAALAAFVNPIGWTTGVTVGSTTQRWTADIDNPALTIQTNKSKGPANPAMTDPVLAASVGVSGTGGYYSFGGNYSVNATIPNHGGTGTTGTHVIIQTGATTTGGIEGITPGFAPSTDPLDIPTYDPQGDWTGGSVIRSSIQIVDPVTNLPLTGGAAPLYVPVRVSSNPNYPLFGGVFYEEMIFEFFLPNYRGDFKVVFDETVHSAFRDIRIDSAIAPAAFASSAPTAAVPEPGTWAALGFVGLGLVAWKRRRANKIG